MKSFILLVLALVASASGQTPADSTQIDSLYRGAVERFLEDQVEGLTSPEIIEELNERIEHPFNLNTASHEDLMTIPGMNTMTADLILEQRSEHERFRTFPQAADAAGLDPQILTSLRMFTRLGSPGPGLGISFRSRMLSDLQPSHGFLSGAYEGSRPAVMNRFTWNVTENIETSFMTEKDAGESSMTDFTSGYIAVNDLGFVRSAVVGDFRVESGNGMSFAGTPFIGTGSEMIISTVRSDRGVVPYRSTNEYRSFRGGGVNIAAGPVRGFLFYSRKKVDATLNDSGMVSSLYESGYHRTVTEKGKRAIARETAAGIRIACDVFRNISVGATWTHAMFEPPLNPVDIFKPSGGNFSSIAVDYAAAFALNTKRETVQLSGEWLRDRNGSVGGTTGILLRYLGLQCEVAYRSYPADLITLFGSGSGRHGTSMQNERGVSMSLGMTLKPGIRLITYYDLYEFPWQTSRNPLPTSGKDVQLELEMKAAPSTQTRIRYILETQQSILETTRQRIRGDVETTPWKGFTFHTRGEWIGTGGESGVLIFQNVRTTIVPDLRLDGRIVYFSTDSYGSALYEYETDIDGVFTTPALYEKGVRWYVMAKYAITDFCRVGFKYAELRKHGAASIGSGYDQIAGGLDNSLHFQVDVNL